MKNLKPVISIQLPDKGGKYETFLRGVADDAHVDSLRDLVTAMCKDHKAFEIGNKRPTPGWRRKKQAPSLRGDEEAAIPGVVEKIVEKAFTE